MKTRILYIEDEEHLGKIVKETLEKQGYEVMWEVDGAQVMKHLYGTYDPDICVLDIMLPHVDGYDLCNQIKTLKPSLPVIFLTARTETADLVKGFESGGTDYIRKPFSIEELIVRIENQLVLTSGNNKGQAPQEERIELGKYTYYPPRYELVSPEGVIDRKQHLMGVWGDDSFFNSRNLDVYIRKIRDYFKHDPDIRIQTLKGKGYLFLVPR